MTKLQLNRTQCDQTSRFNDRMFTRRLKDHKYHIQRTTRKKGEKIFRSRKCALILAKIRVNKRAAAYSTLLKTLSQWIRFPNKNYFSFWLKIQGQKLRKQMMHYGCSNLGKKSKTQDLRQIKMTLILFRFRALINKFDPKQDRLHNIEEEFRSKEAILRKNWLVVFQIRRWRGNLNKDSQMTTIPIKLDKSKQVRQYRSKVNNLWYPIEIRRIELLQM